MFCGLCGSALFSRNPKDPSVVSVRFGAFDEDPGIRPQWRQFVAYAAPWEPIPDDGPPAARRPPAALLGGFGGIGLVAGVRWASAMQGRRERTYPQ